MYADLFEKQPVLNVPGMTEFELSEHVILGLMPTKSIAKIITPILPDPSRGQGIPRCELYLYIDHIEGVYERSQSLGFKQISPLEDRDWGDRAFYLADIDGHVIAFAEKIKV
jgi:lactoylglutathione lyase